MTTLYLLCAVTGAAFVVLTNVIGHLAGGGDGGHGGDAGHGDGVDAGDGALNLPLLSPTALAAYVTGFGSAGLILLHGFHLTNPLIHVPIATCFAVLFGLGLLVGMAKLSHETEGNTLASMDEMVGQEVEVTLAIPVGGEGEVAYVSGGTRQSCMARAEAGQTFAQGARVRVVRSSAGTLLVTRASALPSAVVPVGEPLQAPPERDKLR